MNALKITTTLLKFAGDKGIVRVPQLNCNNCNCKFENNIENKCVDAYYKLYAYVQPENIAPNWSRDKIISEINGLNVPCYHGSCSEVYLEKAFENTEFRPIVPLKNAKKLGETSIMFLVHPTLSSLEIDKTCISIDKILKQAQIK